MRVEGEGFGILGTWGFDVDVGVEMDGLVRYSVISNMVIL